MRLADLSTMAGLTLECSTGDSRGRRAIHELQQTLIDNGYPQEVMQEANEHSGLVLCTILGYDVACRAIEMGKLCMEW